MIRLILILLFLVVFFLISIPIYLVEWLIGKRNPQLRDRSSLAIVRVACRIVGFLAGIRLTVKGLENVPKDRPVLFIGNHRSFFDIIVTYPLMARPTGFLAKIELKKVPFLAWWMYFVNCLFLDRKDNRQGLQVILAAIDKIKNGISIVIFPEGTRNKEASQLDLLPFHEGSFKVATRSGCPVVPMAISGTSAVFEDHMPWVRSVPVTVTFGEPIETAELDRARQKQLSGKVREQLLEMLKNS